jgi:F-type H+-transporting ATPase subunit b
MSTKLAQRIMTLAPTALLASLPSLVLAAQEGAEQGPKAGVLPTVEQGIVPMLVGIAVFGVAFGILALKVWPTILQGLKDRENKIREEIDSAEAARKQAKDALEQYQVSLQQARAEAARMLEQTKVQQQQLAAELKAKSDAELSALRERALKDIEAAKRAAVSELYAQSATLATMVASKILRREIRAEDQQSLVEESLGQMAGMKN